MKCIKNPWAMIIATINTMPDQTAVFISPVSISIFFDMSSYSLAP